MNGFILVSEGSVHQDGGRDSRVSQISVPGGCGRAVQIMSTEEGEGE